MFCKQCGKQLSEDAQFCTGCGAQLGAAPAPVAASAIGAATAPPAPAAKMSIAKLIFLAALAFTALFALIAMIVYLVNYGKYSSSYSTYNFAGWSEIGLFVAAAAGLGLSFSAMRDNLMYRALPVAAFAVFGLADAISVIAINANIYSSINSYYADGSPLGGIITKNIFLMIALLAFNGVVAMLLLKRIQLTSAVMVGGMAAALLMIIMGFICNTALFGFAILFFVTAYLPEIIQADVAKSFAATAQNKLSSVAAESGAPGPAAYQASAPQGEPAGQFCPNCGKALSADAAFCTGCGNQMQ